MLKDVYFKTYCSLSPALKCTIFIICTFYSALIKYFLNKRVYLILIAVWYLNSMFFNDKRTLITYYVYLVGYDFVVYSTT